jgi:hypothetical protein
LELTIALRIRAGLAQTVFKTKQPAAKSCG